MSDLTAERYLSNIGFDDSHLPEMFNDDDKSYYKVAELMEGYFEARNQANGADKSTEPALHKHIVSNTKCTHCQNCGNDKSYIAEDNEERCYFCGQLWQCDC